MSPNHGAVRRVRFAATYRARGARRGSYAFDQNNLDWTGNVLLFSQAQLTLQDRPSNQNVRILAIEDDDGACHIRWTGIASGLPERLQGAYPNSPAARTAPVVWPGLQAGHALQRILGQPTPGSPPGRLSGTRSGRVVNEYHTRRNWSSGAKQRDERRPNFKCGIPCPALTPARRSSSALVVVRPAAGPMERRTGRPCAAFSGGAVEPATGVAPPVPADDVGNRARSDGASRRRGIAAQLESSSLPSRGDMPSRP